MGRRYLSVNGKFVVGARCRTYAMACEISNLDLLTGTSIKPSGLKIHERCVRSSLICRVHHVWIISQHATQKILAIYIYLNVIQLLSLEIIYADADNTLRSKGKA